MSNDDLSGLTTRELLSLWARSLRELRDRGVVRTFNNPIGDVAEALVAAHYSGTRGSFSQKTWDVKTDDELLQVKSIRRTGPGALGNLSPVRSEDGYDAVIAVIFDADLRVERALRIPRETVNALCPHNAHVNGRPIRLTKTLLAHPTVVEIPLSDGPLDD